MSGMSKGERQELAKLVRQRARVEKAQADQRKAELLADFEDALHRYYAFDEDEIWEQATLEAEAVVREAQKQMAARCRELGIPADLAPRLSFSWWGCGRNASKEGRADLRRQAGLRLDAMAKKAKVEIDRAAVETQEQLLAGGLESEEAKAFLEAMPKMRTLIPGLADNEIRELLPGGHGAPCAECGSLVRAGRSDAKYCSDACRQRAYRKRVTDGAAEPAGGRNADGRTSAGASVEGGP